MRALFERLGVENLAQNAKRAKVVEIAMSTGLVSPSDLRSADA